MINRYLVRILTFTQLILITLLSVCHPVFSDTKNIISVPQNYCSTTFYKGLDISSWNGDLNVHHIINNKSLFKFHQELNIILHHTPGYLRQLKIDERLDFDFSHRINPEYSALFEGGWERFIDQNAIPYAQRFRPDHLFPGLNLTNAPNFNYETESNIIKYYFGVGWEVSIPDIIQAEGAVGPIYEKRQSTVRSGLRLRAKLNKFKHIRGLKVDGWMNRLNIGNDYGWKTDYVRRTELTEGATNRVLINYNRTKQYENLFGADSFGQRRDEQFRIINELMSQTSNSFTIGWRAEINRQRSTHIRAESERSDLDFRWINRIELGFSRDHWQVVSYGGIDLQEQQYAGGLSQGNRKSLGLGMIYFPSFLDSVSLRSLVIKYRYDTPDEFDFNDRDELRYHFTFASGGKITPELGIGVKLESDLRHLVYVYRSRSGENRWHRVFRLSVDIPWQREAFRNVAHSAVTSNYTDYDYLPAADNLSRTYRAFTINDSAAIYLSQHVSFEVYITVIIDDHGKLQWSEWIQNLSEDGKGFTTTVVGTWNGDINLIKYGWNWHTRKTTIYHPSGSTSQGESTYSHGPILLLRSILGDKFQSDITARWAYVIDRQRGSYYIPDIRYQLIWAIG